MSEPVKLEVPNPHWGGWYVSLSVDSTGKHTLRAVRLLKPDDGLIPPPNLQFWDAGAQQYVDFAYAGDGSQSSLGRMYGVTQQTISGWLAAPTKEET